MYKKRLKIKKVEQNLPIRRILDSGYMDILFHCLVSSTLTPIHPVLRYISQGQIKSGKATKTAQ
jgi:hypothetical protein